VKTVKMVVSWDVMLYTLLDHISSTLKMGAVFSFEMLIIIQLSNEICLTVKLCDFNDVSPPSPFSVFCADYRSEICFAISPKLSKERLD
jgi:hypothetical protein